MTIWAIADIHASPLDASGQAEKPMEVFGGHWRDHVERIEQAWNRSVAARDTVIVAGDLDWSLHLEDAVPTLERVGGWTGRKLLVRGNHDFWWSSGATSKVRRILPPSISLVHNNAVQVEGFNIVGAKGSTIPGSFEWTENDAKLLNRECERLKLSIAEAQPGLPIIAALHYPPFLPPAEGSPFVDILQESPVVLCVYGHLHADRAQAGPHGEYEGIRYVLAAADHTGFRPIPIVRGGAIVVPPDLPAA
jgi:predicted phosphohydrolase